jgi:hypothetical protein
LIRPLLRLVGRVALLAAAFSLLGTVWLFQLAAFFVIGASAGRERRAKAAVDFFTAAVAIASTYARPPGAIIDDQEDDDE